MGYCRRTLSQITTQFYIIFIVFVLLFECLPNRGNYKAQFNVLRSMWERSSYLVFGFVLTTMIIEGHMDLEEEIVVNLSTEL